jgi:aldehyde dehydrogenase (NAD+)
MTIAREEIFGPVLCMIPYGDENEAVRIANDTEYGLAGYVYAGDTDKAVKIGKKIRAGMLHLNGGTADSNVPFGGEGYLRIVDARRCTLLTVSSFRVPDVG